MSFFFFTSDTAAGVNSRFTDYFEHVTNDASASVISENSMALTYYAECKKLNDIYIRDDHTDSWILLVGMPVLDNCVVRHELLKKFFSDPGRTLNCEIDGHYCLFAFDAESRKHFVATDCNAFIPVFYQASNRVLCISSSELALANATNADFDKCGFAQSISLGVTWGTRTRFKDVRKLGACELMSIDSHGNYSIEKYWLPENESIWAGGEDYIAHKWIDSIKQGLLNMAEQAGGAPISADITGGEDCRIVLALCNSLGIPISNARVRGFEHSSDVCVAREISQHLNIPLDVELYRAVDMEFLDSKIVDISLETDGYGSVFPSLTRQFTDNYYNGIREERSLHLCGMPGGEVYRGSYYLRAKLLAPASMKTFDVGFFTRMKFLLDHLPDLYNNFEGEFLESVHEQVSTELNEVRQYPAGIKVDHLLRKLQTCTFGLTLRQPFYFPLGLREITKTIYSVSPRLKRGSRLTRACTEMLYPELAWIKTQKGIPTVKRTFSRMHLFMPEYYDKLKAIAAGVQRRIFHVNQDSSKLNLRHLSDYHTETMKDILTEGETGQWFRSPDTMKTGMLYNSDRLCSLLNDARNGRCTHVDTLGRIINAELALHDI